MDIWVVLLAIVFVLSWSVEFETVIDAEVLLICKVLFFKLALLFHNIESLKLIFTLEIELFDNDILEFPCLSKKLILLFFSPGS